MSDKRSLLMHQRLCARSVCKVADEDFCTCKVAAGFVREMLDRAIAAEADNVKLRELLDEYRVQLRHVDEFSYRLPPDLAWAIRQTVRGDAHV